MYADFAWVSHISLMLLLLLLLLLLVMQTMQAESIQNARRVQMLGHSCRSRVERFDVIVSR